MEGTVTSLLSVPSVLTWTALSLVGYCFLSWIFARPPKNLPPGPRGWREQLRFLKAALNYSLHELATEWAKKYGPLVYVNCLGKQTAFLNSADITRRLFTSDDTKFPMADRQTTAASKFMWKESSDIFFVRYNAITKKKRRLIFSLLHLYGDGVEKFENAVHIEIERLFQLLEQHENEDYELWRPLARTIKSIVCLLILGESSEDHVSDALEEMDISFNKLLDSDIDFVMTSCPILCKFPGRYKRATDRLIKAMRVAEELFFDAPKKTYVPGKPRGMLDSMLDLQRERGNEWLDDDTVKAVLGFTFLAAHLTSRASLLATFLCLINYPEKTKKIQNEIDAVLGRQQPKMEDRGRMPYTEAVGLEVLRLTSQIPLSTIRSTASDVHIDGMTIPKDTVIFVNNWYFHHQENFWEDPWTFKPERFLSDSGDILPADHSVRKRLLPFGLGIRSCPGEVFARTRIFLVVTSILQKYDILPPANEDVVPADFRSNDDAVKGFVRQVRPYKCRLQRRQKVEG